MLRTERSSDATKKMTYQQIACLLNYLLWPTTNATSKLRITGPFWVEGGGGVWVGCGVWCVCVCVCGGGGGGDGSSIGRPFRSPLRRRRNMAALPLPAAILDDLIPSFLVPGMRSSKMAAGSGRAAILRLRLNGDRKGRPKSWLTSFPAPPSWIQDGGATSNVWRTS